MKLLLIIAVYLLLSVTLGWGVILMMHGKPALLVTSMLVYILGFAKVGCASH